MDRQPLLVPSALEPAPIAEDFVHLIEATPAGLGTTLVRAARAYRDALWIAEDEPALAWVLLVSAVEVAAVYHRDSGTRDAAEVLRESAPKKFIAALEQLGATAISTVAPHLVKFFGSASRFKSFIATFLPPPPPRRSEPQFTRIDWSPAGMEEAMGVIYRYRSNALHAGTPFPPPMSWQPMVMAGDVPAEKPLGGGTHGGKWQADDCPMHLHIFEYIARNSLMAWWRSIVAPSTKPGDGAVPSV